MTAAASYSEQRVSRLSHRASSSWCGARIGLGVLRVQHGANTLDFGDVGEREHHTANTARQQGNEDGLAGEQLQMPTGIA